MVVMKVGLNDSFAYLSKRHVLPTPVPRRDMYRSRMLETVKNIGGSKYFMKKESRKSASSELR